MTKQKFEAVLRQYEELLSNDKTVVDSGLKPNEQKHLLSMVPKIRQMLAEEQLEKAMRWLGFIQGCFWIAGVYTIQQLQSHNREDSPYSNDHYAS